MTKHKSIFFILLFLILQKGTAQEWLMMQSYKNNETQKKHPFLKSPQYDEIAYGKSEKNTSFFNLKGPVEKVNTTTYYLEADSIHGIESTIEQTFNKHLQLVHSKHSPRSNCLTTEEYSYKNQKLATRKTMRIEYSDSSGTNYQYNSLGYLVEKEDYFKGKNSQANQVYHYKTKFTYNPSFSSVRYALRPITKLYNDEMKKGKVTFNFDKNGNYKYAAISYDSQNRPTYYHLQNKCATANSCLNIMVTTRYDARGNSIEQIVDDMTIRNANWSISSHFKAAYDDNNLLIWKEYYNPSEPMGLHETNKLIAREQYEYTFDPNGNWITLKIYEHNHLMKLVARKITYYNTKKE